VTRTGGRAYTLAYHLNTTTGDNPATTTVTVTDPAGNVYQYIKQGMPNGTIYHGPFEVNSVTFPGSPATTLTYKYATGNTDVADLIETDINGVPYSYGTYDSNYEASGTRLADGSYAFSIIYAFSSGGMTATVTNPLGHTTVDNYKFIDGQYLLTSVSDEAVSDCGATTHTAAYDTNGNLTKTVDNDGVTTTYTYAASGQLQTTTQASGTTLARKTRDQRFQRVRGKRCGLSPDGHGDVRAGFPPIVSPTASATTTIYARSASRCRTLRAWASRMTPPIGSPALPMA
jgi:YD repeat-containing protein